MSRLGGQAGMAFVVVPDLGEAVTLVEDVAELMEELVGVGLGVFHEAEALAGEAAGAGRFMWNSDWGNSVPWGLTSRRRLESAVVMSDLRLCGACRRS